MIQEREEYRKSFNSSGQLYVSGEILNFVSYDVSVKGILIGIVPGVLLSEISDFEVLLRENNIAEIYVKDLMLTGEVDIVWARLEEGEIQLGLEFRDVMYNAEKLWRKRNFYRSSKPFSGYLIVDDKQLDFQGVNRSVDGLAIQVLQNNDTFKVGSIIKLRVDDMTVKGLAKIVWISSMADEEGVLGVRYLTIE